LNDITGTNQRVFDSVIPYEISKHVSFELLITASISIEDVESIGMMMDSA